MFNSGYGDGVYPAYWGVTYDGEVVSFAIYFDTLPAQKQVEYSSNKHVNKHRHDQIPLLHVISKDHADNSSVIYSY